MGQHGVDFHGFSSSLCQRLPGRVISSLFFSSRVQGEKSPGVQFGTVKWCDMDVASVGSSEARGWLGNPWYVNRGWKGNSSIIGGFSIAMLPCKFILDSEICIYTYIYIYLFIWVNLITTSLVSRTLESWFILGKSSPNGRKIQVSEIL